MSNNIKVLVTNGYGLTIDEFNGRWLGYIKDEDANALINDVEGLLRRAYTSESLPLAELDVAKHQSERLIIANTQRRVMHISPPTSYGVYVHNSRVVHCEGSYEYHLSEIDSGKTD